MRYPDFDGTQPCFGEDMDIFFPENRGQPNDRSYDEAREICSGCSYLHECAIWATKHDNGHGFFGGLTPNERRALRSRAKIKVEPIKVQHFIQEVQYASQDC
jgi:WhiB family transcriptional regulator, redox-sensing transcriptional regulator